MGFPLYKPEKDGDMEFIDLLDMSPLAIFIAVVVFMAIIWTTVKRIGSDIKEISADIKNLKNDVVFNDTFIVVKESIYARLDRLEEIFNNRQ